MISHGSPLPAEVQLAVIDTCFAFKIKPENENWSLYNTYFDYYQQIIESNSNRSWSVTKSHSDILSILQLLKQSGPKGTRDAIQARLRTKLSTDELEDAEEIVQGSLNLAVRLLLMVSTGRLFSIGRPFIVSGETRFGKLRRFSTAFVWD